MKIGHLTYCISYTEIKNKNKYIQLKVFQVQIHGQFCYLIKQIYIFKRFISFLFYLYKCFVFMYVQHVCTVPT